MKILLDMKSAPVSVITNNTWLNFVEHVVESAMPEPRSEYREFVEVCFQPLLGPLHASKTMAPSEVIKMVRMHLHSNLAEPQVLQGRMSKLQAVVNHTDSEDTAPGFLQDFCGRLAKTTAAFIIKGMREAVDDPHTLTCSRFSQDNFDSLFSQQTLHNILGSTVKGVLRRSRQFKQSSRWNSIQKVVLNRFAHIGLMEAKPEDKTFWTALLGRKSYTFVSEPVLCFFIEIAKILCYVESSECSIPIKAVLKQVNTSPCLLCQWCEVVGHGLKEEDSFFLMRLLITSLCRTFGRGVMLRRTNLEAERRKTSSGGVTSVGIRARLVR